MFSRDAKPILGLIVLLLWPCLGWGGRAEAGFARGMVPSAEEWDESLVAEMLKSEEAKQELPSRSGMGDDTSPSGPDAPPSRHPLSRHYFSMEGTLSSGMSSRGGSSSVSAGGSGLTFVQQFISSVPDTDTSVFLPTQDEKLVLSLVQSRLFRPPRLVCDLPRPE